MTKKISIPTLLFVLLLSINLQAQFSLGFRAGATLTNIDMPEIIDDSPLNIRNATNSSFALVGEYKLGPNFAIQPELAYSRKGFTVKEKFKIGGENIPIPLGIKSDLRLSYIEMPVLMKYTFGRNRVRGYVTAGPSIGYAASGRFKTRATVLVDIPVNNTKFDLDNLNFNRVEVAGTVGAGMSVPMRKGEFFVDARYTHAFTDVNQLPIIDLNAKNKSIGLNVGFLMPIGGAVARP